MCSPCRTVVLPTKRLDWINGRKPFALNADIDYDYESDDDWEGWDDQEEIVDVRVRRDFGAIVSY